MPASSANLGPGFDVLAAALSLHLELEVVETGIVRRASPSSTCRATARNLIVRAFERLHPADDFEFRIASKIPLSGGLGSSAAAIVAGLLAADHMFELDADVLALATELEGHPDNVAAALEGGFVDLRRRPRSTASTRRWGSRRCWSSPTSRSPPPRPARRCPPRCRSPTRCSTSRSRDC